MSRKSSNNGSGTLARQVSSMSSPRGFTLLELMVAIGLMVLIMEAVAAIFNQSSTTYMDSMDRMTIYNVASVSCDRLMADLNNCLPLDNEMQSFTLGEDVPDEDTQAARDYLIFKANVSIKGKVRGAQVTYRLDPDTDPTVGGSSTVLVTKRRLYVLRREVAYIDENNQRVSESADLCHYVLSFNVEYYDRETGLFRQISNTLTPRDNFIWPIGDGSPTNEVLHSAIRVTLRVVASATERQERMITRVIWLPVGQ